MRLDDEEESRNIEDRRGGGLPGGAGKLGFGTVVVVLLLSWFLGVNPSTLLGVANQVQQAAPQKHAQPVDPAQDPDAALMREMAQVLRKT